MPSFNTKGYSFRKWLKEGIPQPKCNYVPRPQYKDLPAVLKHLVSPHDFAWFGGHSIDDIEELFCYPEAEGDY